ncbi:MAG: hypothetical protein ACOYMN_13335, partial [Roseimicrobium sp.]
CCLMRGLLVQAGHVATEGRRERRPLTKKGSTILDRETWGLDAGGNWLSHTRSAKNLLETRSLDNGKMNRITSIGGAGSTVVEGNVNEFATVNVNGQPAAMQSDPVSSGYRFHRTIAVEAGSNVVEVTATDTDTPPRTTSQRYRFTCPP